jgi:hypothetical protein
MLNWSSNMRRSGLTDAIVAGVSYPLTAFSRISGLRKHAIRSARRKGLRVRYVGGRAFISGDDWLVFIEEHGDVEPRRVPASV